jgi:hypothetical protein
MSSSFVNNQRHQQLPSSSKFYSLKGTRDTDDHHNPDGYSTSFILEDAIVNDEGQKPRSNAATIKENSSVLGSMMPPTTTGEFSFRRRSPSPSTTTIFQTGYQQQGHEPSRISIDLSSDDISLSSPSPRSNSGIRRLRQDDDQGRSTFVSVDDDNDYDCVLRGNSPVCDSVRSPRTGSPSAAVERHYYRGSSPSYATATSSSAAIQSPVMSSSRVIRSTATTRRVGSPTSGNSLRDTEVVRQSRNQPPLVSLSLSDDHDDGNQVFLPAASVSRSPRSKQARSSRPSSPPAPPSPMVGDVSGRSPRRRGVTMNSLANSNATVPASPAKGSMPKINTPVSSSSSSLSAQKITMYQCVICGDVVHGDDLEAHAAVCKDDEGVDPMPSADAGVSASQHELDKEGNSDAVNKVKSVRDLLRGVSSSSSSVADRHQKRTVGSGSRERSVDASTNTPMAAACAADDHRRRMTSPSRSTRSGDIANRRNVDKSIDMRDVFSRLYDPEGSLSAKERKKLKAAPVNPLKRIEVFRQSRPPPAQLPPATLSLSQSLLSRHRYEMRHRNRDDNNHRHSFHGFSREERIEKIRREYDA